MSDHNTDNYVRCHQAVQLVCSASLPCIQSVLDNWHQRQRLILSACSTPKTCINKGKPKLGKGSCQSCVSWGHAVESVMYPSTSSSNLPWTNINPTLLHDDPVEVAKAFVLRLPPGHVYNKLGDFDAASLLMIMMKFTEFHQGNQPHYEVIKKISDLRNTLSHMKVDNNLIIEEGSLSNNFSDLEDFVVCLSNCHPLHISHNRKTKLLLQLHDIYTSPVTQALKTEVLKPFTEVMGKVVRETIQDVLGSGNRKVAMSQAETSTDISDFFSIDVCRKELAETYREEKGGVSLLPFDIDSLVNVDDIFVNLELLERRQQPDEIVRVKLQSYEQLVRLKRNNVLIKGGPGSGKTTLTKRIALDWAEIKSGSSEGFGKFQLLFSLNMRNLDQDMSLVDTVFDQLLPNDSKITREGLEAYIKAHPSEVVIVLDGADEFRGDIVKSPKGNLIVDILCNRALKESIVIVTTRPNRVREFSHYSQVELSGFSEKGEIEFVGRFFQVNLNEYDIYYDDEFSNDENLPEFGDNTCDDMKGHSRNDDENKKSARSFIKKVWASVTLNSLSCIPVMLTMLCILWKDSRSLPDRITTLYHEFMHYLTQRWLEKQTDDSDSDKMEREILEELGKTALNGLFEDRLLFTHDEFLSDSTLKSACDIGITLQDKKRSKLHIVKYYSFFHKSFQEYCAALYLAILAESNPSEFCLYLSRVNNDNIDSYEYLLAFCCGLSKKAAYKIILHKVKIMQDFGDVKSEITFFASNWISTLRFFFESSTPQFLEVIRPLFLTKHLNLKIEDSWSSETYVFLDYFFECFKMFNDRSDSSMQLLSITKITVLITYEKEEYEDTAYVKNIETDFLRTSKMLKLILEKSKDPHIMFDLVNDAYRTFPMATKVINALSGFPLTKLEFKLPIQGRLSEDRYDSFLEALGLGVSHFQSLKWLKLFTLDGPDDISSLLTSMASSNLSSIQHFECADLSFSVDSMATFLSMQRSLISLSIDTRLLMRKQPRYMSIVFFPSVRQKPSPECTRRLLDAIRSPMLTYIYLQGLDIEYSIIHLQRLLPNLLCLKLSLTSMKIADCKLLFGLMYKARNLVTLELHDIVIGGIVTTVSISPVYTAVKTSCIARNIQKTLQGYFVWMPAALDLTLNRTGTLNTIASLRDSLSSLLALKDLRIVNVRLIPENIGIIAEGLQHKYNLKTLDLSLNVIHGACAELVSGLKMLKELSTLCLNHAELLDTDAIVLSGSFQHLPCLSCLELNSNFISFKGMYALCRSFHHLPQLSELSLAGNPIGTLGALALCNSFRNLPRLTNITLNQCSIDSSGLLLLALSFRFVTNLRLVHLALNKMISPKGITWLFEGLHVLNKLEKLFLEGIDLQYNQCDRKLRTCFEQLGWDKCEREDGGIWIRMKTLDSTGIRRVNDTFSMQ